MPGVAIGECKVTVTAYEGGKKPSASENFVMPSNAPTNPEEMKKKMDLGSQMRGAAGDGGASAEPKSIIPEIYGKPATTTLTYTVDSDASKNQFAIDLKE
jgi:hypothetical protein